MLRTLAAAALAATLLGSGAVMARNDATPLALPAGPTPPADLAAALSIADASGLKGASRVAVNSFSVVFVHGNVASSQAQKASVTVSYELQGVGPADFQLLTDQAYERFVAALGAAGFEVLPRSALAQQPAFTRLQAAGQPSGQRRDAAVAMAPAGLNVPPLATAAAAGREKGLGASLAGLSAIGSAIGGAGDVDELARALNATVLDLIVVVDFAELQASGGSLLDRLSGTGTAKVSSKASVRLVPEATVLRWFTPAQKASSLTLNRPLLLPDDTIAEVTQRNSAGTTAGNVAGALISFAAGTGSRHETREYQAIAQPEPYRQRVGDGLAQFTGAAAASLGAAR